MKAKRSLTFPGVAEAVVRNCHHFVDASGVSKFNLQ